MLLNLHGGRRRMTQFWPLNNSNNIKMGSGNAVYAVLTSHWVDLLKHLMNTKQIILLDICIKKRYTLTTTHFLSTLPLPQMPPLIHGSSSSGCSLILNRYKCIYHLMEYHPYIDSHQCTILELVIYRIYIVTMPRGLWNVRLLTQTTYIDTNTNTDREEYIIHIIYGNVRCILATFSSLVLTKFKAIVFFTNIFLSQHWRNDFLE